LAAEQVMAEVNGLLPPDDRPQASEPAEERFELDVAVSASDGTQVEIPDALQVGHGSALSMLLHQPAVIAIFRDRLHLPVVPFQHLDQTEDAGALARAADSILGYLARDNPYFLTYRFGAGEGGAMQDGLAEFRDLARWAEGSGLSVSVTPVRRFRRPGRAAWEEERGVGQTHAW
jgi:hypothetical protein